MRKTCLCCLRFYLNLLPMSPPASVVVRVSTLLSAVTLAAALVCGCAFDLSSVEQKPATFTPQTGADSFVLAKEVTAHLGTGFPTTLRAGARWRHVGSTEAGQVYATSDQVVNVEASNIDEAYIVVHHRSLAGFYLPEEKTLCPLSPPIPLQIQEPSP